MDRGLALATKDSHMTTFTSRILTAFVALTLVLGACSSDSAESESATDDVEAAAATDAAASTDDGESDANSDVSEDVTSEEAAVEDSMEDADEGDSMDDAEQASDSGQTSEGGATTSETESTMGEADLAAMLPFFGVTDPAVTATCVREEAENEGMSLDTLMAGDGSSMMVAVVRCSPEEVRASFAVEFGDIDSSSIAANPGQIECAFDSMLEFIADIELAEAEGVLTGDAPDELVEKLVGDCDISSADADFLLNEA